MTDVYRIQVVLSADAVRLDDLVERFGRDAVSTARSLMEADGVHLVEWAAAGTKERPRVIRIEFMVAE